MIDPMGRRMEVISALKTGQQPETQTKEGDRDMAMSRLFSWISEGGASQKEVIATLKQSGIKAVRAHSPYVGHRAIEVCSNNQRTLRKAERILFGK